jgi:hypothetical protein
MLELYIKETEVVSAYFSIYGREQLIYDNIRKK